MLVPRCNLLHLILFALRLEQLDHLSTLCVSWFANAITSETSTRISRYDIWSVHKFLWILNAATRAIFKALEKSDYHRLFEQRLDRILTACPGDPHHPYIKTFCWSADSFSFPFTHLETLSPGETLLKSVTMMTMELLFHWPKRTVSSLFYK